MRVTFVVLYPELPAHVVLEFLEVNFFVVVIVEFLKNLLALLLAELQLQRLLNELGEGLQV